MSAICIGYEHTIVHNPHTPKLLEAIMSSRGSHQAVPKVSVVMATQCDHRNTFATPKPGVQGRLERKFEGHHFSPTLQGKKMKSRVLNDWPTAGRETWKQQNAGLFTTAPCRSAMGITIKDSWAVWVTPQQAPSSLAARFQCVVLFHTCASCPCIVSRHMPKAANDVRHAISRRPSRKTGEKMLVHVRWIGD